MSKKALFVGLVTLDLIYLAEAPPQANQKLVANDYTVAAGGPATNAAVTFSFLGDRAHLLGVIGSHPINQLVLADLKQQRVAIANLNPAHPEPVPTSSIVITQATGERAVISLNAAKSQAGRDRIPAQILDGVDIVLIDGHQMAVGEAIAQQAKTLNIPIVVDGGSWKTGFETVLSLADYAICSANFCPPDCSTPDSVLAYLQNLNIPQIAITQGEQPIQYISPGQNGQIPVPTIQPVDTLGAGDIFHGAFCHFILQTNFPTALSQASTIAARACQAFGTRRWMSDRP